MRDIKSFVKREGRITLGQKNALLNLYPKYGLSVEQGQQDLQQLFNRSADTILEIGFGNGNSLLAQALASPELNFIGVEVHRPGVGALLMGLDTNQVDNVRLYQQDALRVLKNCICDNSLSRVQLYFPDPWPKKRHHKRRIVQLGFVELIRKKLKINGIFHLATDWQPYAEHMLDVIEKTSGFVNLAGAGQYSEKPAYRPLTKFEQRGKRLGHNVYDLLLQKLA